jgi:hypothetical protein
MRAINFRQATVNSKSDFHSPRKEKEEKYLHNKLNKNRVERKIFKYETHSG